MPLDSTTYDAPIDPSRLRGRDALAYLADALREPLPETFSWFFGTWLGPKDEWLKNPECGFSGCAIGLAAVRGIAGITPKMVIALGTPADATFYEGLVTEMAARFGLDISTFRLLFVTGILSWDNRPNIRPEHVAAAIDYYLGTGYVDYQSASCNSLPGLKRHRVRAFA